MNNDRIQTALAGAEDTKCLRIGSRLLEAVPEVLAECFAEQAVVVADENTFAAAGQGVQERLRTSGKAAADPIVFPGSPSLYADFDNVLTLQERLKAHEAVPVVVGSGTLNDLTKLASHRLGRQYMCVATAASMDGYTAFGAAITKGGFKQTMSCPAPRAVVADLEVLVQAPKEMNATGYGDLLGKVTAGADWLLADALEIEPIDPRAWSLVQDSLRAWTSQPDKLKAGDAGAIVDLFEGLIMAGIAMQISGSSRPASGTEHRLSHLWEMQALASGHAAIPHGFKVAVGTVAAAAIYERLLAKDLTKLDIDSLCRQWPSREELERHVRDSHDAPQLAESAVEESLAKYIDSSQLKERLKLIQARWPELREKLKAQFMPAARLRELLQAAGCPTRPEEIGLTSAQLRQSYPLARTIRARYTVLDLLTETGLMQPCVDELFAPGGFWA